MLASIIIAALAASTAATIALVLTGANAAVLNAQATRVSEAFSLQHQTNTLIQGGILNLQQQIDLTNEKNGHHANDNVFTM